jgi:hypothetical protein
VYEGGGVWKIKLQTWWNEDIKMKWKNKVLFAVGYNIPATIEGEYPG